MEDALGQQNQQPAESRVPGESIGNPVGKILWSEVLPARWRNWHAFAYLEGNEPLSVHTIARTWVRPVFVNRRH